MKLQTIIFDKKYHTLGGVKTWLKTHKYKTTFYGKPIENTKNFYRARQFAPSRFITGSYRTINKKNGIKFVFGKIKS